MERIFKTITYKYIVVIGVIFSWILCYNQLALIGMTILSMIIFILYLNRPIIANSSPKYFTKTPTDNNETIEWLNTLLQRWWLFSISGSENYFRNKLNKLIKSNMPEFFDYLTVDKIIFGNSTPNASNIKLVDLSMPDNIPAYLTDKSLAKLIKFVKETRYYCLLIEMDVNFHLDGSEIYLVCKHKKCNVESTIILRDFAVSGRIIVKMSLDTGVAFPHISRISAYFSDKLVPKFDYKISFSKVFNLIDRFKFWITWIIHSNIIKQKFKLSHFELLEKNSNFLSDQQCVFNGKVIGVVVITVVDFHQPPGYKNNFKQMNLCTIGMGNQIHDFRSTFQTGGFFSVVFLVQNIEEEQIMIKLKSKNPIGIQTLAIFNIALKDYPLEVDPLTDITKNENQIELKMKLEYIKLKPISDELDSFVCDEFYTNSGVLYVDIIAAQNLFSTLHNNNIDTYCVLFANQHKIFKTGIIKESRYPKWNAKVEFFIHSLKKVTLTFVVYNERHETDDGLHEVIGLVVYSLKDLNKNVKNQTESLKEFGINSIGDKRIGKINFNIVFRPIEAVKLANNVIISLNDIDENGLNDMRDVQHDTMEKPLLKLVVKGARNLIKKDIIGSSDPYFKVLRNGIEIYKSKVIKNSLNPQWHEKIKITDFEFQDILRIELYDKDLLKRDDFMGRFLLDAKVLHELSMMSESKWFNLDNATDGDIHIEAKFGQPDAICEIMKCRDNHNSINTLMNDDDQENSDSDTCQSSSYVTLQTDEISTKNKRLSASIDSVVLNGLYDSSTPEYILKADLRKLKVPSKCKHIIKAYSTSQIEKTIFFSNYAFAITYCPSKGNLKLKFKLIQKKSKKKVDEVTIELKKFEDLLKRSKCQLSMAGGSVINILCREHDN